MFNLAWVRVAQALADKSEIASLAETTLRPFRPSNGEITSGKPAVPRLPASQLHLDINNLLSSDVGPGTGWSSATGCKWRECTAGMQSGYPKTGKEAFGIIRGGGTAVNMTRFRLS